MPFLDSSGKPILDKHEKQILRPYYLPPELFVREGLIIRKQLEPLEGTPPALRGQSEAESEPLVWAKLAWQLYQFRRTGSWNAQRVYGKYVKEYRDYATIAIGLYMAAAGIPIEDSLSIQNQYAHDSIFDPSEPKDEIYTNLSVRNVENTKQGYKLYESGAISP